MSRPLTILFPHHRTDELTRRRYAGLVRRNPGVPVVPLTVGNADVLPGTFDGAGTPGTPAEHPWAGADLGLYAWFRHGRTPDTTAERYAVVEYDVMFTVPLVEFYRPVWQADLAAAQLFFAGPHHHWNWFPHCLPRLPPALRPHAVGAVPIAAALLSHRALAAASAVPTPPGVFCECRLATLVNAAGGEMVEFPYSHKRAISWKREFISLDRPAPAYHPVKTLTPWDLPADEREG